MRLWRYTSSDKSFTNLKAEIFIDFSKDNKSYLLKLKAKHPFKSKVLAYSWDFVWILILLRVVVSPEWTESKGGVAKANLGDTEYGV